MGNNNFLKKYSQLTFSESFQFLHLLPLIYPTFTHVDPDFEYGSTKILNTDPFWIRIHNTAGKIIYRYLIVLFLNLNSSMRKLDGDFPERMLPTVLFNRYRTGN